MAFEPDVFYRKGEYIETDTGNKVSRRATIQGAQNIILGGKTIIQPFSIIRGDLRRSGAGPSGSSSAGSKATVVISLGRYCLIGEGCVVRPPGKCYRGIFNYYPVKIGDNVHIGANTIVEAAHIGNCVEIGKNCVIGKFAMIKDCARIADNTIIADMTVVPPFAHFSGAPGRYEHDLPESTEEHVIAKTKGFYSRFKSVSTSGTTPSAGDPGGERDRERERERDR